MSVRRFTLALVAGALLVVASPGCSSADPIPSAAAEVEGDVTPVPNPPPRYARVDLDAGVAVPEDDDEPTLHVRCTGQKPYVCPLDDGTFRCSEYPCVPGCERVGCLGGAACLPCDDGFRCVARGESC